MKKILSFLYIMMAVMAAHSQVVNLKFAGADRTGQDYVRLHHVSVYDHDQLWHQVIYYPDTTLALYNNGSVGIAETNNYLPLRLTQNTPNPFAGTTDVMLSMADEGDATLEIADGNGKIVGMYHMRPYPGVHQFRITLSTAGTYVMTARQNGNTSSIKMVCNGGGSSNSITHVGTIGSDGTFTVYLKNAKSNGSYPFTYGDKMEYIGYAVIDDIERVSEIVTGNQYNSFSYKLNFDVARPEITTLAATDVTAYSATLHGEVTADNNALVTERGFCWKNGTGNPTMADHHVAVSDGMGAFSIGTDNYSPLQPGTAYRVRAYAMNAIGLTYGNVETFTTDPVLPTVVTIEPTNAGCSTFMAGGQINYNGGANITAKGICWNTIGQPTIADAHTNAGTGISSFTSTAMGLQIGTLYYVRAYATNSAGTGYGEEFTVTTDSAEPEVITLTITLNHLAATVGGEVTNEHCLDVTTRGICWNTTGTPTLDDSHTTNGTGLGTFAGTLENLTDGTTYYARAYATNAAGTTYGNEVNFTAVAMPTVITTPVSDITAITATGGGNVISDGGMAVTTRGICWNTTGNPTIADSHTTDGTGTGSFTSNISGLTHSTTYYVRAYATNSIGTTYGEELSFTTLDTLPTVITSAVTNISATAATCGGNITDDGGATVTARGVCWSTSHNPTLSDSHTTDGSGTGSFNSNLANLTPNTTYYVQAYATNSMGTMYGEEEVFTTNCNSVTVSISGATTINIGQNTTLSASGASNYQWNTGSATDAITVSPTTTTIYTVTGTNQYGCTGTGSVTVTVILAPTVTTNSVSSIASSTAVCGGNVTDDGGATVTERGVCWSTNPNPTIVNSHTIDGSGTGSFTSNITGLTVGITYYVRAYATNTAGTAYGNAVNFTATVQDGDPCPGSEILTDRDGNTYNTVHIGQQCWMKENLRTTHFADGTVIENGGSSYDHPYGYYDGSTSNIYGYYYNGAAATDIRNLCPTGWHVPSDAEWTQLTDYISTQNDLFCSGNGSNIAKAMAVNHSWNESNVSCSPGLNQNANNTSGFSAFPAGRVYAVYEHVGEVANFWTSTKESEPTSGPNGEAYRVISRSIIFNSATVQSNNWYDYSGYKIDGKSVRCVRDEGNTLLSVTTATVNNITEMSAICGGTVTSNGGPTVTAKGVCWSTFHNPGIANNHTTDGSGIGSFTSNLMNLIPNTTYYVRAYATNSAGTAYGNEVSFTTSPIICGTSTLTDIDGNVYNTVQIGTQCWMKQNLKTTKYADGTYISQGSTTSTTTAYWYYPNNSSSNKATYGLLYNWKAVMRNSSSSSADPSGVQGVCPTGWHVPSDAEWTQLINYVSSQSQYVCGSDNAQIAKALSGTTGWSNISTTCAIGNTPSSNNATGFGALPAGDYTGSYNNFGNCAYFWNTTEYGGCCAYDYVLAYYNVGVYRSYNYRKCGQSVRCVKD